MSSVANKRTGRFMPIHVRSSLCNLRRDDEDNRKLMSGWRDCWHANRRMGKKEIMFSLQCWRIFGGRVLNLAFRRVFY